MGDILSIYVQSTMLPFLVGLDKKEKVVPELLINKNKEELKGIYRIGPHNLDIISIFIGALLGKAWIEPLSLKSTFSLPFFLRNSAQSYRICFYQEDKHLAYIFWLHKFLYDRNYTYSYIHKIGTKLGRKGIIRKTLMIRSWDYTSFKYLYDLFYINNDKRVPLNIGELLNPLALSVWIMDDAIKFNKGLKFIQNSFNYSDCKLLIWTLEYKYNIKADVISIPSSRDPKTSTFGIRDEQNSKFKYNIYIKKESISTLRNIISPYLIAEMKYKVL